MTSKHLAALAAVAALAAPTAATADSGKSDAARGKQKSAQKGKGQSKAKNAVFKGTVASVDAATGTVTVTVAKASRWGRSFKGTDVAFTVAGVKQIGVADVNADGKRDLADFAGGEQVLVQARVTRDAQPPLAARKLNVQTPEAAEAEAGDD